MDKQILVRGVDTQVYRRAKALAALRGLPMGKAISEALRAWVEEKGGDLEVDFRANLVFATSEWAEPGKHRGKAVVISSGKLQGIFESYEEACAFSSRFKMALTFVVGEPPKERDIELGHGPQA